MTTPHVPQFHRVPGRLDTLEAMAADGRYWTLRRVGARWPVFNPDGQQVGGQGERSKERGIEACRALMRGEAVEPPAAYRASDPVPVSAEERKHRARVRALG